MTGKLPKIMTSLIILLALLWNLNGCEILRKPEPGPVDPSSIDYTDGWAGVYRGAARFTDSTSGKTTGDSVCTVTITKLSDFNLSINLSSTLLNFSVNGNPYWYDGFHGYSKPDNQGRWVEVSIDRYSTNPVRVCGNAGLHAIDTTTKTRKTVNLGNLFFQCYLK